jgi:CRISPR-associated protein Cas8a1/Csx13
MAKKLKTKPEKPPLPDHLTMRLFAPGMSLLHRAGLGGLACTLKAMGRQYENGLLAEAKLPAPFDGDTPPWEVTDDSVTLHFGKPERAEKYLKKLFEFAFDIGKKDGLIRLPGQFNGEQSTAVLADLQQGLTLTFLQHGKVRLLAKEPTTVSYDPEGEGVPGVEVTYRKCSGFKHQEGWNEFVDANGCLSSKLIRLDGPICPGTVVRHVAFTGDSAAEEPADRMLPLYFALVGCLPLSVNRGVAALLVPEVENLLEFIWDRPAMTPTTAKEAQIANAADAALQSQWRLRHNPTRMAHVRKRSKELTSGAIRGVYAMTFTPTAWASQQKSRVATIHVPKADDKLLDRFERALTHLPLRIVSRKVKESTGRGKNKTVIERTESFRADSIVRPLIAENLARGRPWYSDFIRLMTKTNPATDKPYRNQLPFERKGLHAMISDPNMWDDAGESIVVQAVHSALRGRYAQIADENKTNPVAMRNRFGGEYDRWRLAFAGSKTADQFRKALCDLFSRAGRNEVLQQQWQQVLPMLRTANWQHARDLALLAMCSYQGRGAGSDSPQTESK